MGFAIGKRNEVIIIFLRYFSLEENLGEMAVSFGACECRFGRRLV